MSTLLPFYPEDPQQLERKRHLGNDVCLIIFREEGCTGALSLALLLCYKLCCCLNATEPFNPSIIRSHFNHVFVVVQPDRSSGALHYKCALYLSIASTVDSLP